MSKKLLLIDAFSLAFRAFYSYPTHLRLPDGTPTNAVFGFLSMIFKAIDDLSPTHVCICFDKKEPTFRHDLFPDYKGNRVEPPDEFKQQVPHLFEVVSRCGIASASSIGYEADDIIGTLSSQCASRDTKVLIITGDHDALQLVTEQVSVVMNKKGVSDFIVFTPEKVKEKYGFGPENIVDFKSLKGDPSDNIPGVKGIGDKTATQLIQSYGSLEAIYSHFDAIGSKSVKLKLSKSKDVAFLSHRLATIFTNVPLEFTFDSFEYKPIWADIISVFSRYQLSSLVKKYTPFISESFSESLTQNKMIAKGSIAYYCIQTLQELEPWLKKLMNGFAIDLETTSLSVPDAEIVGVSLSCKNGEAIYLVCNDAVQSSMDVEVPLFSFPSSNKTVKCHPLLEALTPLLEDGDIFKVAHNAKYDIGVLKNYGIQLKGLYFDTMIASFLAFPGENGGLKDIVSRHLGISMTTYDDVVRKNQKMQSFLDVPIDKACDYACADADMTWRLYHYLKPLLVEKNVDDLFYSIEMPCMEVLSTLEQEGISLDRAYLQGLSSKFMSESEQLKEKIWEISGKEFNINSPKQLAIVLFEDLRLPVVKKTKTGRSTDSSVLEVLAKDYDIARYLMRYRSLEKLLSTYVLSLPNSVSSKTGKVHTSFNQTVAITGRLSSSHPNLQNIPIKTEEGRDIRRAFIPSDSSRLLMSVDYSQIELRVMAYLSQDKGFIQAFKNDEDIHARTAAIVHSCSLETVSKEQRYAAKAVNFGILYGQSAFSLSEQLGIERKEAQYIIDDYFTKLPKVKEFIDSTIEFTQKNGLVKTEFGRFRWLPDITNRVFHLRQFAERAAVNTRVQGTAADIMKMAMICVHKKMIHHGLRSKMVLQVHDELVFDMVSDEEGTLVKLVTEEMENVVNWEVPLKVDIAIANNWGDIE